MGIIDEIFKVKNEEAFETVRLLAKTEGLLVGISSGAAVLRRPISQTRKQREEHCGSAA